MRRGAATRKLAVAVPAGLVEKLEAVARARRTTVDAVTAELLRRGLGTETFAPGAGAAQAAAWKAAFGPLTEEEMLAVDGILMGGPVEQ